MNQIIYMLFLILKRVNGIYAHLEVEWDRLSEHDLSEKYKNINKIIVELNKNDLNKISNKKVDNR